MDQMVRKRCTKNVLKEVSKENNKKTSEGEQVTASNSKLHSSCENQKPMFLGLLKGLFLKSWSQREEVSPRHLWTTLRSYCPPS